MSAPDFYFAVNAMFRFMHDRYGKSELIRYWRSMGTEHYASRTQAWHRGGVQALATDWREFFEHEPGQVVDIDVKGDRVELNIRVCPAIKHLRDHQRDIVPYFCEHCDHVHGAMAEMAGYKFERTGGMGACQQSFTRLTVAGSAI